MIIIIEGPDLAGKTTFARKLSSLYDGETITLNYGPPPDKTYSPYLEYEADFLQRLPADPGTLVICDRLAAGEMVYGPLLRRRSRLSAGGLLHCEMLYEGLGAYRFMMMPPLNILISRFRTRGDALVDVSELAYVRETYSWIAPRYHYTQLRDTPADPACRAILDIAADRAELANRVRQFAPGYIGTLTPDFVLAGDVRAGNAAADPFTAPFTPEKTHTGSQFLMKALGLRARTVIRQFGMLNANEPGMNLAVTNANLGGPRWIALGGHAAGALNRAGIPHVQIAHPQWVNRFAKGTPEDYSLEVLRAAGIPPGRDHSESRFPEDDSPDPIPPPDAE